MRLNWSRGFMQGAGGDFWLMERGGGVYRPDDINTDVETDK